MQVINLGFEVRPAKATLVQGQRGNYWAVSHGQEGRGRWRWRLRAWEAKLYGR